MSHGVPSRNWSYPTAIRFGVGRVGELAEAAMQQPVPERVALKDPKRFKLIGQPETVENDPRFATMGSRTEHIDDLYRMVAEIMQTRSSAEWLQLLQGADIPAMPLHTPESLMRDEHLHAVGFFKTEQHPSEGPLRAMAVPGRWSATQPEITRHAPRHGEHSVEILRELGYDEARIRQLLAAGTTLDGASP